MDTPRGFPLWLRWVGANALAETLGLGLSLAADVLIISRVASAQTVLASTASILLMTASGAIEGAIVGLLQWSVLRRAFPGVARRAWVLATILGAMIAWFLGSLPSTLMDMGAQETGTAAQEPAQATVLLLAAAMGLFLGAVLGLPQRRVLQRVVPGAWLWVPANCVAWALGLPVVFAAVDLAYGSGSAAASVAILVLALALTGAIVGAVHGLALVKLARQDRS